MCIRDRHTNQLDPRIHLLVAQLVAHVAQGDDAHVLVLSLIHLYFSSTLKVDRKGLSIGTVEQVQFNDYVSVDGQVVPISVVQISSEEGGRCV